MERGSPREVKVVHPSDAEKQVSDLSSRLLDMTQLRGEVTQGGPAVSTGDDGKGRYSVHHYWSIWKLSPSELEQGFQRLREELPKQGIRVTHYGPANSEARQLEINAEDEKTHSSVSVELLLRSLRPQDSPGASKEDLISFSVVSPVYRVPEGVDLNSF
ncbi:hypothetical protein ACFP1Z_21455 [Streptomyces gamaensis]|uniref:Uncharacterized protein n=1 Tax=Streptomyces gamaensis TaxID=1763542 RepID=A0ABW0Z6R8_9ACTN